MKKQLYILASLVTAMCATAQNPTFQWAKQVSGFQAAGISIMSDTAGNVYSTGFYSYSADFDPGPGISNVSSTGYGAAFISKLDAAGNFVWAKNALDPVDPSSNSYGQRIVVDAVGNSYLTGVYSGTVDADPGPDTLTFIGSNDMFLSKFDPNGNLVWAKSLGSSGYDYAYNLTLDAVGHVYMCGYFESTIDLDPNAGVASFTAAPGSQDMFILKLDTAGNFAWAKQLPGTSTSGAGCVRTDAAGNLFATGYFAGTTDFDPGAGTYNLTAFGQADLFFAKYDGGGNFIWARQVGGDSSNTYALSMALDAASNMYALGYYSHPTDFDPGAGSYSLTPLNGGDSFVTKLDSSGNLVWAKSISCAPSYMALDTAANVYCTGTFANTVDFDPGPGTYTLSTLADNNVIYNSNSYVLKLNSAGNFVWAVEFESIDTSNVYSYGIHADLEGNVYTTGLFDRKADFDPSAGTYTLGAYLYGDDFIHKMSQCIVPPAPINVTPPANQMICAGTTALLLANGPGTTGWYTSSTGGSVQATGNAFQTPTLTTGTYTYYAEAMTCTTSALRSGITVTVSACTGIVEENELSLLSLYPNPTTGKVMVKLPAANQTFYLSVYTITGQLVLTQTLLAANTMINLEQAPKGIYFVQLSDQDKVIAVKKVVKE